RAMGFRVESIGLVFTVSQFAQVVAMLLAPILLARMGLSKGIAVTQAAAGLALVALGFSTPVTAAILYPAFMAFQYMTEPGIFSVLMSGVPGGQRTAASAMNFVVTFSANALAAWIAGSAIAAFGYPPVLTVAGALALLAALAMNRITFSR